MKIRNGLKDEDEEIEMSLTADANPLRGLRHLLVTLHRQRYLPRFRSVPLRPRS